MDILEPFRGTGEPSDERQTLQAGVKSTEEIQIEKFERGGSKLEGRLKALPI